YNTPEVKGQVDSYYIRDNNADGQQPQRDRYALLWNHYQKLTPRLTANAKMDLKSDQVFGNQFQNIGNDVRVENQSAGVLSEGGLNYQFPRAAVQVQASRQDRFDATTSSSSFISFLSLPNITYNTIPLIWKQFPIYTSFAAHFTNQTVTRALPTDTLRYQRSAGGSVQLKKDLRIGRRTTFTPIGSYEQNWQDSDFTKPGSSKDIYLGRYTVGSDLRRRLFSTVDGTFGYRFGQRFKQNQMVVDQSADDHGVETNALTTSFVARIGRDTRTSLSSGYDFRAPPKSDPSFYAHEAARLTPPTADVQWQATRRVSLYYRETYALYDSAARRIIHTPLNTSGSVEVGDVNARTFFSQGFSFTKPIAGQTSDLLLNNKVRFFPTAKWYVDFFLSYRMVGPRGLDYRTVKPIEKTINVTRDMHCWVLRMQFSERPGRKEASFYIDLKTNLSPQRNLFATPGAAGPEQAVDVSEVFPAGPSTAPTAPPPPPPAAK
ncbi:MAG: hypothetical protein JO102_04480, partial [Elusimicrobia bacterium]|nr:hypothetical protein [Elusimicrobiota bacterium]